jgi:hypothetical protein
MANQASRLVNDLSYLPAILGRMGLSVAEAQDELNNGYVQAVAELVKLLGDFVPKSDRRRSSTRRSPHSCCNWPRAAISSVKRPSISARIWPRASMPVASGELRLGTKAVALNAAMAVGFGYDYRAAARITCKLHALPAGKDIASELLARVGTIDSTPLLKDSSKCLRRPVTDTKACSSQPR